MAPVPSERVGTCRTTLNLLKAYLGTGLLTIPFAISCSGLYLGVIGVGLMTFFASHTMKMLVQMKRHIEETIDIDNKLDMMTTTGAGQRREITYEDIGMFACGIWGKRLSVWAMLLTNIGTVIGYMIFIGSTAIHAAEVIEYPTPVNVTDSYVYPHLNPTANNKGMRIDLFLLALIPILGLLSLLRTMKKLAFVSIFGTLCIIFAIAVVVFNDELNIGKNGISNEIINYNFSALPTFFGIAVFSFSIHGVVLSIVGPMERPQDTYTMMNVCSIVVGLIYCGFGYFGYAAFGPNIKSSILDNILEDTSADRIIKLVTYILMILCITLSIPLFNFPVFRVIEESIWKTNKSKRNNIVLKNGSSNSRNVEGTMSTNSSSDDLAYQLLHSHNDTNNNLENGDEIAYDTNGSMDDDGMNLMSPVSHALYSGYKKKVLKTNDICHREVQRGLLRLSLIIFMTAVAIAFGNIFSDVIALVGAFSMSTLAFILPSSFFIRIMWQHVNWYERLLAIIVFVVGFFACIIGTFVAVNNIILSIKNGGQQSCSA
jgi:solute carrier family 36 (proton-coupled amino acid transporter)